MNIQILAERRAKALNRIKAVAPVVATRFDMPDRITSGLTVCSKDPQVEAMLRMEAVADLMEFLVPSTSPQPSPNPLERTLGGATRGEGEKRGEGVPYLLDLPMKEILKGIEEETDPGTLIDLCANEKTGKKRKQVIAALEKKAEELTSPRPSPKGEGEEEK